MKCEICGRRSSSKYCKLHEQAYRNLLEKYEVWKEALGISWKEYLREVAKNPYTGDWAREIAEHLLKTGADRLE